MSTQENKLTAIANAIRAKLGTTEDIAADDFAEKIASIPTGVDTSDATATVADILSSKTAYTASGKITGSIPIYTSSITTTIKNNITGLGSTLPTGYYKNCSYQQELGLAQIPNQYNDIKERCNTYDISNFSLNASKKELTIRIPMRRQAPNWWAPSSVSNLTFIAYSYHTPLFYPGTYNGTNPFFFGYAANKLFTSYTFYISSSGLIGNGSTFNSSNPTYTTDAVNKTKYIVWTIPIVDGYSIDALQAILSDVAANITSSYIYAGCWYNFGDNGMFNESSGTDSV